MLKTVRGSKGYSLLEVVIAMTMLGFIMLACMQFLSMQYNARVVSVINRHYLNVANTVGSYLAANDDSVGDAKVNALRWGRLGLADGLTGSGGYSTGSFTSGQSDLRVLDVTVNDSGWVTPAATDKAQQNAAYGSPMIFTIGGAGKTKTIARSSKLSEDTSDGVQDGVVRTTVSNDMSYNMYVFKEINSSLTPKITNYRVRIEPSTALRTNLGEALANQLGVEVTFQQIRAEP